MPLQAAIFGAPAKRGEDHEVETAAASSPLEDVACSGAHVYDTGNLPVSTEVLKAQQGMSWRERAAQMKLQREGT